MLRLLAFSGVVIVGLLASVWSRFAALLSYVWYGFFRPEEWLYTDITSLRLSLVFGVLLIVPSLATGILPTILHPLSVGAVGMLGAALVAQLTTPWPGNGWEWIDTFTRLIVVCCFATTLLNSRLRITMFLAVIAAAVGFHAARGGLSVALLGHTILQGIGGAYSDSNGYAMLITMTLPFMVFVHQNWQWKWPVVDRWVRRGFLAAIPLSVLAVAGTMSRAGVLSLLTVTLIYIAFGRNRLRNLIALVATGLLFWTVAPLPQGYVERLETIRTYEEVGDMSALSRRHYWSVAFMIAQSYPLGVGLRNFDLVYDRFDPSHGFYGVGSSVHSSHLQVMAEAGYAGLLVWGALFGFAFLLVLRIRGRAQRADVPEDQRKFVVSLSTAICASMAAFVVGGSFIALALNDLTWYTFAVLAALDRLTASTALRGALSGPRLGPVAPVGRSASGPVVRVPRRPLRPSRG